MHITDAQLATYKEQGFLIIKIFFLMMKNRPRLMGFLPFSRLLTTNISLKVEKITRQGRYSFLGITQVLITSLFILI